MIINKKATLRRYHRKHDHIQKREDLGHRRTHMHTHAKANSVHLASEGRVCSVLNNMAWPEYRQAEHCLPGALHKHLLYTK